MTESAQRFQQAIQLFDQENSRDPNKEVHEGQQYPKELLYSQRMTAWLLKFEPRASEVLQLAARSQHICRWTIPRDSYPMDRKGYLSWRSELKSFHARKAQEILEICGYPQEMVARVKSLILKKRLKTDPESQTLEDVVCLVFLDHYFGEFASKHEPQKVISILKKTWKKMSEKGHQAARALDFTEKEHQLVRRAVG